MRKDGVSLMAVVVAAGMMMMLFVGGTLAATPAGVLPLDAITFDKVVDGHHNVLVKFDKKYAYGNNQDEWEALAKLVGSSSKLLLAEVNVAEHGEKENQALLHRFSIKADSFPQYRLYKADVSTSKPLVFEGEDKTSSALSTFLKTNGIWIGLEGSIEAFEMLANEFMGTEDESLRTKIGEKGKDLLKTLTESQIKSANYYMKVMANIIKNGKNYASDELERLKKMLEDKKNNLPEDKLAWFRIRSNILSTFVDKAKSAAASITSSDKKKEL
jgi:endoplasmic reticulum protein 29